MFKTTIILPLFIISSLMFAPLAGAQDAGKVANYVVATATVAVEPNGMVDQESLRELVNNPGFLESASEVTSAGDPSQVLEQNDRVFISAETLSTGVITIRAAALNSTVASESLKTIFEALKKFEPPALASLRARYESAKRALDEAAVAQNAARESRGKFILANGTMEPTAVLDRQNNEIADKSAQLEDIKFRLATEQATRDLYREILTKEPQTTEVRRTVANPRRTLLERQLEAIGNVSMDKVIDKSFVANLQQFLNDQRQWISEIEKQLADPSTADNIIVEKTDNPRRAELEAQIFQNDRTIAELKSTEAALGKRLDFLREESIKLWKLSSEWQRIHEELSNAEQDYSLARERVRAIREEIGTMNLNNPWCRLVTGPTVRKVRN